MHVTTRSAQRSGRCVASWRSSWLCTYRGHHSWSDNNDRRIFQRKVISVKIITHWLKTNSIILVNAGSIVGTTAITSGMGFVYWWIAAKWFSPDALGVASASISAVMLLAEASILGQGTLLITELPRQPEQAGSMLSTALIVVGTAGAVGGASFALIVSHISP